MQQGQTAREQFQEEIIAQVLCAYIVVHLNRVQATLKLRQGYTEEEYQEFLSKLEFDRGNAKDGFNYISGTVWISETEWYERAHGPIGDYWVECYAPQIPLELINQSMDDNKERELLTKMYHAVTEINDGIFEEINTRIERIAQILVDAGYSEDDIKKFVKEEIYPSYNYIN